MSLLSMLMDIFQQRKTNEINNTISGKEYEIAESMKPALWELVTAVLNIKTSINSSGDVDLSYYKESLRTVTRGTGYTVILCSLDHNEGKEFDHDVKQLIEFTSSSKSIDSIKEIIDKILKVLEKHKDLMDGRLKNIYDDLLNNPFSDNSSNLTGHINRFELSDTLRDSRNE